MWFNSNCDYLDDSFATLYQENSYIKTFIFF